MFGRIVLVLLCLLTLQTNLFARGCSNYNNHVQPSGSSLEGCRSKSIPLVVCSGFSSAVNTTSCAFCGVTPSIYCGHCGSQTGINNKSCHTGCVYCNDQCSADSVRCLLNGESFDSQMCVCVPDTSYKCTSVSTENNVIRSQIDYIVHDSIVKQKYIIGSCIENNFCEAGGERQTYTEDNPTYAYDSCSFDSVSVQRCKFVGQNGSQCRYVCPDGRNWNCRQVSYSGINIPQCPSVPWKECADEYVPVHISTPPNPMSDSALMDNVISAWPPPDFSDPDLPDALSNALDSIVNELKKNDHNNKLRQYADGRLFDVVAGYGDWDGDGVWQNTKRVVLGISDLNADVAETNGRLESVVINQEAIIKKAEFDTFKVAVQNDSTTPVWVLPDWEPLVFAVDTTAEKIKGSLDDIKNGLDTIVNDTPRVKPILIRIADKFDDVKKGLDSLVKNSPNPIDFVQRYAKDVADSIENKLKPFIKDLRVDSLTADSLIGSVDNFSLPSADIDTLPDDTLPFDTIPFDSTFFEDVDSLARFIDSLNQERLKKDTTIDTLPLDKLSGDSAEIRNKLSNIFLPDVVLNSCFEFHMHPVIRVTIFRKSFTYDLSMVIDFADLFGWDLCEFIRKIVEILTFILIVFTTIKGYIRAFGGSNIGG